MSNRAVALIALCGFVLAAFPKPVPAAEVRHHIRGATFASEVQQKMTGMKLRLNNHHGQSSFVEIGGFQLRFDIPRTVVDIDCGTLCPDLGDGHFYINDVNLSRAGLSADGSGFTLALSFEGTGREVKGYHNKLGDDAMPDFQLNNLRLSFAARPKVNGSGDLALAFSNPHMNANISSTGGCHLGGIDLCDKIFGSNRKIQKSVENSAVGALNGNQIQNGLAGVLKLYLQSKNINGKILSVQMQGGDLVITTQGGTTTADPRPRAPISGATLKTK